MAFKGWERIRIHTDKGGEAEAIAPVIISASRATDLPAFHADWFMNRLRKGYLRWTNPFNAAQPQYVSFANTRVIVFWSKNPQPMLRYLDELTLRGINCYFTYTVNDYEAEGFEPNVPSLTERVRTFAALAEKLDKRRVIWRFDPLLLTDKLSVGDLLRKIEHVGEMLHRYTEKLVVSFADIAAYVKVQRNLQKAAVHYRPFTEEEMRAVAAGLQALARRWAISVCTCGEEIDLSAYDIQHNRCIDDELMIRCFAHDQKLMDFLGYVPPEIDLFGGTAAAARPNLKDKGQRAACGCIVSKDIGQYNTCMHLCRYCYANASPASVAANRRRFSVRGESILG